MKMSRRPAAVTQADRAANEPLRHHQGRVMARAAAIRGDGSPRDSASGAVKLPPALCAIIKALAQEAAARDHAAAEKARRNGD
jgi:hypothetical protein